MYLYVLSVVIVWITIKFIGLVWNYVQTCRRVSSIPKMFPQHFFWGYMYKAQTFDELMKLTVDYIRQKKTKWFTGWNMCFYPVIFPADPTTIKEVMTATNLPKNTGFTGAYRMMLPWIGDGLLVSSGRKWEHSRHLLTPAFHFQILKGYTSQFNATADIFLGKLAELSKSGKSFDVFPPVGRSTLDAMLRCSVSFTDDSVQSTKYANPYPAIHSIVG